MRPETVQLRVGATVWWQGQLAWVQELGATTTALVSDDAVRCLPTRDVISGSVIIADDHLDQNGKDDAFTPSNVTLSGLSSQQRQLMESRAKIVRSILSRADAADVSITARCESAAAEHGVSARTLRRWVAGYQAAGAAGLVDSRVSGRYAQRVDPRWDAACLAVLREHVADSTPTMNVVIDRVRQRVEEEHGAGVVSCPSRPTAYRRLTELSRGRHAFGSGKGCRSAAQRPATP